jgi:diadenosine tetraphosphate (Ap4A) HIT family hydrolase
MNESCLFCAQLNSLEIVFEDNRTAVALHEDWAVRGHAMVIWKGHVENVSQLSEGELAHFIGVYQRAERALLDITGADRAVMLKLGIVTPHLHVHIYPVSAALLRAEVIDIIEGHTREPRDEGLVRLLREALTLRRP